ncbi:MAG: hypothetical protein AAF561_11595 [Planctomycetota bacterium]
MDQLTPQRARELQDRFPEQINHPDHAHFLAARPTRDQVRALSGVSALGALPLPEAEPRSLPEAA